MCLRPMFEPSRRRRVLVLDGDRAHVKVVREALEPLHWVLTAEDASTALEAIRAGDIDLLVTDLEIPGAGGLDLVRRAREIDPHLSVIVVSGQFLLDGASMREAVRGMAAFALPKPVPPRTLSLLVNAALAV